MKSEGSGCGPLGMLHQCIDRWHLLTGIFPGMQCFSCCIAIWIVICVPPLSQVVEDMTQQQKTVQLKYKKAAQRVLQGEQAIDRLGMELQQARNEVWSAVRALPPVQICICPPMRHQPSALSTTIRHVAV